ncbi:RNA binding protein Nova 1, partial [Fasciolopsis buskii]
ELSQTYDAVAQLLVKIADDPQSSSCPNISYAEVPRPVASAYPTGSPYALVMGSGFGLNNCPVPLASSDPLLGGCNPTAGPNSNVFPPTQLNSLSPISPSGSTATPGPVFGTSPPAFAAAVAAMGAAASFSPTGTGSNRTNGPNSQTAGRALTGRSLTAGHHSNHSAGHASQSLLGSVANQLGQSTPPAYGSPANTNSGPSPGSATIGLEVVRNILRTAGYSDIATEEIANAMHVLNLYGFISMSSLTGCTSAATSVNSSLSNGHYAMTGSPLGNLSGSLSGYVSAGPQSPGFSGEVNSHFRGSIRNLGMNCAAPGQQSQQHHHSATHYYQQQHPCTNTTTTRRSSLHMSQQQPIHAAPNVCAVPTCSPPTNSISLSKNMNSNDAIGTSAMTNVAVTCRSDPTSHLSTGPSDLFVNSGDIAVAAAAAAAVAAGANPGLHSSTQSPIKTVSPLSPCLTNNLPLTGNGLDLMQRLAEAGTNGQLRPEEGSTNGSNCSSGSSGTKVMNGARPSALWGVNCPPQSSSS